MDCRMHNGTKYTILPATIEQWDDAMEVAFLVFLKYEAPSYGKEGTDAFREFVTSTILAKQFVQGTFILYVATLEDEIIGVGALRSGNHISLLFVKGEYHRQGVASKLMQMLMDEVRNSGEYDKITVNSSPYGRPFYERLGFVATQEQKVNQGIIYIPMEYMR